MRRIGVLTSGGDAPGMNAAIRAVVRKGIYEGLEVFGIEHGYAGLIRGEFQPLDRRSVADIIHRGGTILFTARSEAFKSPEGQAEAVAQLRRHEVEGLVVIGGDGSFRGAMALEEHGVPTVGVPGTIDNDLAGTDTTIGFDTSVNTAIQAIDRIRDTATAHERTFVVEVMGRNSGFIALMAGLADGAESILVPEEPVDLETVCERVRAAYRSGKRHSIIVVAEGAARGFEVAQKIQEKTGLDTRVTVLGHIQRGGPPTAMDRLLASQLGAAAVDALLQGRRGCMAGLVHGEIRFTPYEQALAERKDIDRETYRLAAILAI
ncbi:MAG: 6-phosphofructokinase [Bacillota bacterium]|nr:6-phosphofructokinase [Bacillota bacterium]